MNRTLKIIKQRKNKRKRNNNKFLKNKTLKIGKIKGGFKGGPPTVITLSEDIFEKPEPKSPKSPKSPKASAAHSDTITIINEILETELQPIINEIPHYANNESLIYVSVGSKYNEDTIIDTNPPQPTNSLYQMIPFFLSNYRNHARLLDGKEDFKEVLNIVIDEFDSKGDGSVANNIRKINMADRVMPIDNIKMFIINVKNVYTKILNDIGTNNKPKYNVIEKIIETITKNVRASNIDYKNYMVCNYVKFKNQMAHEKPIQIGVQKAIHDALSKYEYANSLYNWFGYNRIFYNFIYQGEIPDELPVIIYYVANNMKDKEGNPINSYNLVYKISDLKREGIINLFLSTHSNKMFMIVDPEIYDNVNISKTQNNFMYSLKEMRDVVFPQTNVPGTVFRR